MARRFPPPWAARLDIGRDIEPACELPDDLEVDVRLEQRQADLAHRARNRLVVEPALLAQVAENPLQLVGKRVEHDRAS